MAKWPTPPDFVLEPAEFVDDEPHPSTEDMFTHLEVRAAVREILDGLSDRERQILVWRYRDGETHADVGERIGLSLERVRQIEKRALRTMRKMLCRDKPDVADDLMLYEWCTPCQGLHAVWRRHVARSMHRGRS